MTNPVDILPVVALRGTTVLPGMIVHFDVNRQRSVKAIEAAMLHDQKVFLLTQRDPEVEEPGFPELYQIGTVAWIKQVVKLPQDLYRILVEGIERRELLSLAQEQPYLQAETAGFAKEEDYSPAVRAAMHRGMRELFHRYCVETGKISKELANQILGMEDVEGMIDQIAVHLPMSWKNQQKFLEAVSLRDRYEVLGAILASETEVLQITRDLQKKVKARVDKNQREYILREQLKVIREELGEDHTSGDAEEFRAKLGELPASPQVKEKIAREIDRYAGLSANAAENSVLRGYIETVLSLPWDKRSKDSEDLAAAWKILQEGHYGLRDVKERIMEFLSVRRLTKKGKSPILCLVGPPGTGKTSIAQSVAQAMNRKYVRICLGGVRDEAEIRGHRKTYVGAMPGRVTVALQQAGVGNPVVLLDEIDKTSSDYKGDTSSALLEVLDPEQNSKFNDHYIEIPQDLSEVLFIATANDASAIPRPLLDRMELIEISGYTENEKEHIAREHLIPKQMEINGIQKGQLVIQKIALTRMINHYTKEAGVRSLERLIGRICRKSARAIMEDGKKRVTVTGKNLSDFLGKERYNYLMANEKDEVGIARGLAWTQVGGDTLEIEVNVMPGKGELILTGQLGDVMKESAQAGITYIRSVAGEYEISQEFFQEHDIHVHIPEGAVPKDGPSAGITMATAMLSAVIGRPVRADVAMTGEITLRGRVLPIGGLKEKLLAAKYARIKEVLVPGQNKPDIEEMDGEILEGLQISYVNDMGDVLKEALAGTEERG
ncbi:MAG: endopeptidase La [Clostridiales bacterium]|nr:endopeptidase La [Clostridiales bacterium]